MNARLGILCLAVVLPACAGDCSCGTQAATTSAAVTPSGAQAAAGQGAEDPTLTPAQRIAAATNKLTPMPDSEQRRELEQAEKKIDTKSDLGKPIEAKTLAQALPDEIADYAATSGARTGTSLAELGSATEAARDYKQGKAVMHVKVTDTADAPAMRAELASQLTQVGNKPTGKQTGALSDDVPGVRAYHAQVNAGRAVALIGNRFLVEVVVDDTVAPDDAWKAIAELDADVLEQAAR